MTNTVKLATLIYVKDKINKKTLMMFRNKKKNDMHEGKYNGLGGKFEKAESPQECAIRELKEESGLIAKKLKFKGILFFPNGLGTGFDWHVYVFIVDEFEGELINCNEGDLKWVDDDKLLDLNLNEGDYIFMKWFKREDIFLAKFNYEGKKLKDYKVDFY